MLHAIQVDLDLSDIIDKKSATLSELDSAESILWFRNTPSATSFVITARSANLMCSLEDTRPISVSILFGHSFSLFERVKLVGSILAKMWGHPIISSEMTDYGGVDFRIAQGDEAWKA